MKYLFIAPKWGGDMARMKKHKGLKIGVVAVLLLCGLCWVYAADYYHADDAAVAAMSPAADVTVEQKGNTLAFIPDTISYLKYR